MRTGRAGVARCAALVALMVIAPALAACDDGAPRFVAGPTSGPGPGTPSPSPPPAPLPFSLTVTPAAGADDLPISTEIGTRVTGGRITGVRVADNRGAKVSGALREDGSSWVPAAPLRFGRTYTATVTATADATGEIVTRTTRFSTMRGRAGREVGTGLYLFDGNSYGVAMPVVVEFFPGIAASHRADVQRRMFVRTDPPQPGTWHWLANGTQAFYRAPRYWQPGTTITVRLGLDGHPVGNGRWGTTDRTATVTIARRLIMDVDNQTKQMLVYQDDRLLRTIPVSLGKPSTPSSSGTMVVMDKQEKTVFDTRGEPNGGYVIDIEFAQRLTWGGEFVHSAPWSVGDQGRRNVSHGCVNMSAANAAWLYGLTRIGDPVTVRGTERGLTAGNGWTAWDLTWPEFVQGSALPVPAALAAAEGETPGGRPAATTPSPTTTATP